MRKALLSCVLVGLVLWLAPVAKAGDSVDAVEKAARFGKLCLDGMEVYKTKDPAKCLGFLSDYLSWTKEHRDEKRTAEMEKAIRDLQKTAKEIPLIKDQLAKVGIELEDRPTHAQVNKLLDELRTELRLEILSLEYRHNLRFLELEGRPRPFLSHLLFATGRQEDGVVVLGKPNAKGVTIVVEEDTKVFPPGEVSVVTTPRGRYFFVKEKQDYVYKPHVFDPTASADPEKKDKLPPVDDNDKLSLQDQQVKDLMNAMSPGELWELRGVARRRGLPEWDTLKKEHKYDLVKLKIAQDYGKEIRQIQGEYGCTETAALRVVIDRLAKKLPKKADTP